MLSHLLHFIKDIFFCFFILHEFFGIGNIDPNWPKLRELQDVKTFKCDCISHAQNVHL